MTLTVDNLAVERGGRRVFEGVGFALRPGQALYLRGPNGAGKSSLLRCLAGLVRPAGGTARWDGDPPQAEDTEAPELSERLIYAGHLDAVKPALTVHENLIFWARLLGERESGRGDPDTRTKAALERFGLLSLIDLPGQMLSAGQKKRLGLARLLVCDRPLWLLDEPTVSLDAASVRILTEIIRAHLAGGGIALIATHVDMAVEAGVLEFSVSRSGKTPEREALL